MQDLVRSLLVTEPRPVAPSVSEHWSLHRQRSHHLTDRIDRAILGGSLSERVGYAMVSGYQEGLRSLLEDLPEEGLVSFCASEEGGAHPSRIRTRLEGEEGGAWRLHGSKRWSTLAPRARLLLVVASIGEEEGRNRLRLVRIERDRPGVTIAAMPPTEFTPEIEHGEIVLDDVRVEADEVDHADAYLSYLKPFRTVEDLFVHAALLGCLFRIARRADWPREELERILAVCAVLRGLASCDPAAAEIHLPLAGALELARSLREASPELWARVETPVRERWERDRALARVASNARERRRETAWSTLCPGDGRMGPDS